MSTIAPGQRSTSPSPHPYRLTVDEYERLVKAGVLDDPRVELIDGYVVKKMGKNPPHIWVVDRLPEIVNRIINQVDRRIEVYTDPTADGYLSCQFFTAGEEVPVVVEGTLVGRIAVSDVFPS